ncbi:MAG: hypothetical protein ACKVOU_00175 [Cytophagales bacterium]
MKNETLKIKKSPSRSMSYSKNGIEDTDIYIDEVKQLFRLEREFSTEVSMPQIHMESKIN